MFNRKGQGTLEYALIIAVVVAGLLLMQYYVKRGFAGRLKSASDEMCEQFDPTAYNSNFQTHQQSETRQSVTAATRVSRTEHIGDQLNTKQGQENVAAWGADEDLYKK
jgi:hypothetical protein